MNLFTFDNFKQVIRDLYATLSNSKSYLSSKRLERFSFIGLTELIILGTFAYLVYMHKLTAVDAVILTGPLLIAAGFNMNQTEKSKKDEPET